MDAQAFTNARSSLWDTVNPKVCSSNSCLSYQLLLVSLKLCGNVVQNYTQLLIALCPTWYSMHRHQIHSLERQKRIHPLSPTLESLRTPQTPQQPLTLTLSCDQLRIRRVLHHRCLRPLRYPAALELLWPCLVVLLSRLGSMQASHEWEDQMSPCSREAARHFWSCLDRPPLAVNTQAVRVSTFFGCRWPSSSPHCLVSFRASKFLNLPRSTTLGIVHSFRDI